MLTGNKKLQLVMTSVILMLVPMSYNSCSSSHKGVSGASSLSSKACGLNGAYRRTWQPFLKSKCSSCHVVGGQGKGAFADSNSTVAFNAFQLAGYSKIGRYATNPSHNPPYTGDANKETVEELTANWAVAEVEAVQSCGGEIAETGQINEDFTKWMRTKSKGINIDTVDEDNVIEWDLSQDMLPTNLPTDINLNGVKVRIKVEVKDNLGDVYYSFTDPVLDLTNAQEDLRLTGLAIVLNGNVIDDQTAFFRVDQAKRDGDGPIPFLSSGAMIIQGTARVSDTLALTFRTLENVDLGPRPQGIKVNFSSSVVSVGERGTHTYTVSLTEPILTNEVTVGLEARSDGNAIEIYTDRVVENEAGEDVLIRNFDWDYDVPIKNVIFFPGETVKTFDVVIHDDERDETLPGNVNEDFEIRIGAISGGAEAGEPLFQNLEVTILDDDDPKPPTYDVATYTELMSPGGVFYRYCIKCHNSVDLQGGYDITNHQQMVASGVIVPGDPLASQMHIRINLTGEGRMPISAQLDLSLRREVEKWIEAGALND